MRTIACLFLISILAQKLPGQKLVNASEICAERKKSFSMLPPSANDTRSDSIDLLHTTITLDITDITGQKIAGDCRQRFTPKVNGVPEIRLDLEALTVDSVQLDGAKIAFTHANKVVRIVFPLAKNLGDTSELRVFYRGKPTVSAWGGFYFQSGYAYNLGVGIGVEPPNFGRAWYPCFDNFEERGTYAFIITSPMGKPAYCNGLLINEETLPNGNLRRRWQIDQTIPSYLTCVAVGPYVSFKRTYSGENGPIPVEIAVPASDSVKLRGSFVNLSDAIAAFEYWYGPYRWDKVGYSIVPFNAGAMEHATNIAYMRSAVDGTTASETLMAHELSHHWWGDLATCSTAGDMWLNEGWASYSEHLFTERVYGRQAFVEAVDENHLSVLQGAHINEGGYLAVSGIPAAYTYGTHVYNKGASMAHNLRGYLGDSLFRVACRTAMAQTEFSDWSSAEFRDKIAAATGRDLTDFFNDWVFAGGYADYVVDSFATVGSKTTVYVKQKLRGAPHLHQNVPLEFTFLNNKHEAVHATSIASGEISSAEFDLPWTPVQAFVNYRHHLNIARADKDRVVKTLGNQAFAPAKMDLKVNTVQDSAYVRVEHHFAAPDDGPGYNPLDYKLTTRFWTVRGDFPASFDASATIFYDGRSGNDVLDSPLFAQTGPQEDSLRLLYRSGAGQPWAEFNGYTKTMISPADRFGFVRILKLLPGDYTFGKGISTVGSNEPSAQLFFASAAPNPTSGELKISGEMPFTKLLIYNQLGDTLRDLSFDETQEIALNVNDLPNGTYWFVLSGKARMATGVFQKL